MQIDPKIIEAIMSGQSVPGYFSNRTQGYWRDGTGDGGNMTDYFQPDGADTWTISQPMGNNMVAEWLGDGSFRGINQDTSADHSNGQTIVQALILAAAGAAAYGAGAGAAPAATEAGAGGWADWATSELAGAASNPTTAAQLNAWSAGSALPYAGGGAGGLASGAASGGASGTNWADWAANEVAGASTNPATASQLNAWAANSSLPFAGQSGLMSQATQAATNSTQKGLLDKVTEWASNPSNLARLGLAAAAAADSKDRQQVTQQEPWGPAQPFLKGLIGDTADLWSKYRDQPMSDLQRQAYGNQFGLLNAMNGMAPGLLSGMNANSSGANNYDRTNPRRSLVGNTAQLQWAPGLLNLPPKG
jgi:hypothetical protein